MSGYHWLVLKDGQTFIGIKGADRASWAVLTGRATFTAVDDSQILAKTPIRFPAKLKWLRAEIAARFSEQV